MKFWNWLKDQLPVRKATLRERLELERSMCSGEVDRERVRHLHIERQLAEHCDQRVAKAKTAQNIEDLSLVDTEALIDALISRHDSAVLVLQKTLKPDEDLILRRWKGRPHVALGLTHDLGAAILTDIYRNMTPPAGDWEKP